MTIKFIEFQKSKRKGKKYDAIIYNTDTNKYKRVPFGSIFYGQFMDSTGLGLYTHLDHHDSHRRRLYRLRHQHTFKKKFSPSYFSYHYLW